MVYGENHPNVASSFNNIGFVYANQGNYSKALEYYEKALNMRLSIYGEQHPDVADSYENLYDMYTKLGDTAKAEEFRLKVEEIRAKLQ